MKQATLILKRLLYPPIWVLVCIPLLSFTALAALFIRQYKDVTLAYLIYCMSAYSLTIWVIALPKLVKRVKTAVMSSKSIQSTAAARIAVRYHNDLAFRGSISIYQGMAVNFFYVIFRIVVGIRYASAWFISMAVYYLVLGCLRTYLLIGCRRRSSDREYRCYRTTALLLFLLNVPMGGMIVMMVRTDSGFFYPGYVIYLSALYTFYTLTMSVINLIKFRKLGSPILSAAKVLNFVAAMMSILGLQTAMISRFSESGEDYRKMMNAITGGFVYGIVIIIAIYMLLHSRNSRKKAESIE